MCHLTDAGSSANSCPGPTSLVPGFLWGNSPLTLRLSPCPRLTPWLYFAFLLELFWSTKIKSKTANGRTVSPSLRLISMGPWTRLWSYRGQKAMPSWWALTRGTRAVHGCHCSVGIAVCKRKVLAIPQSLVECASLQIFVFLLFVRANLRPPTSS